MWDEQEFIGKARRYFSMSETSGEGHVPGLSELWLLLGLELLLRAPLARVHPSLLAVPEGDSILHAAGVVSATARPKSITTKTVVDRLSKIDPTFGVDRARDALFLADLRNSELHSSDSALESTPKETWLPKLLSVVEPLCEMLGLQVDEMLNEDIVEEAEAYRELENREIRAETQRRIARAALVFAGLTEPEREARRNVKPPYRNPRLYTTVDCPACHELRGRVNLSTGRSSPGRYDEENNEVIYTRTSTSVSMECPICGLTLDTSAQVLAAGLARIHHEEFIEGRYEGWEELMTYADAVRYLGAEEAEYGND